jgi:AraC family transcriptional regulator of adaptative response/methylated-DNA-[protein]-cysteine methyltransferase
MIDLALPAADEMYAALLARDASYEGVFVAAVRTTGVFCRPTCPARKPRRDNVEFHRTVGDALAAGYRPCRRCQPMQPAGGAPQWLEGLLADIERDPARRWRDDDLRARGLEPARVRRWFQSAHGITFHAYQRTRRLGKALGRLRLGDDLSAAAHDSGFESESGFREAFARVFGEAPGRKRGSELLVVTRLLTPLGPMVAGATDRGVCLLEFADRRMLATQLRRMQARLGCAIAPGNHPRLAELEAELNAYFAGALRAFTVPLRLAGTEFQRAVWERLLAIPFGATSSYEQLARAIGRSGAQRAVGRANGDNPLAIVVPCHRVVRADGTLCGYGGGLWRKRWLLAHEGAVDAVRA